MKRLNEEEEEKYFSIDPAELYQLFEPDNIRENISLQKLQTLGGIQNLTKLLKTDLKKGLHADDKADFIHRQQLFGKNEPYRRQIPTLMEMILECFEDLMLQILCVAAAVSTGIGILQEGLASGWMEGATILLAVVLIVSVTATNNYIKEQQFQKLQAKSEGLLVEVVKGGKITQVDIRDLVVGDILLIQIGDILQVDSILVEGSEVKMDESSITGEPDILKKVPIFQTHLSSKNESSFILSGTKVMDGSGKVLVGAVGNNTNLGKIREKLQEVDEPTPLQQKLETIADQIGLVGTVAASLTMIALLVHLGVRIALGHHCGLCYESLNEVVKAFMTAVTIIVVAVPEGLPLAVSISLAFSVNKMKDENNLVKRVECCETMGGATNICSDKTGTLTQNLMSLEYIYIQGKTYPTQGFQKKELHFDLNQTFCHAVCFNSTANPKKSTTQRWEQIGNKTECALLEFAFKLGTDYEQFRSKSDQIVRIIPFSSARKKMSVIYKVNDSTLRVVVKGATEVILDRSINIEISGQQKQPLSVQKKAEITKDVIDYFSSKALRTLGIAYKDIPNSSQINDMGEDFLESDLNLIAICGIKDPLRPEIKGAIATCKKAGILVRMVTGDNVQTAVAIAQECGILSENYSFNSSVRDSYEVIEGKRFRELVKGLKYDAPAPGEEKGKSSVGDFQMFKAIIKDLKVMARSTPEDKYILVTGLKQMDEVVAVTGDGTNDAPALKKADIGFAMGIAGTEVAKDAAGIILLDDNFASILTACKWGRNIYDSIRKFIQFQLTVNAVALFMSLLGAIVLQKSPLNSIQMLWVNVIMDTFASLALSTEPPTNKLLERKPYSRTESIVTPNMWRNVFGQSIYQIIMLSLILFKFPEWLSIPSSFEMEKYKPEQAVHFTIFFQAFVLMQVFNEFNARKLERGEINIFSELFNNFLFWLIILVTFGVQFALIFVGGKYVGISRLTLDQHIICLAIGSGSWIVGLLIKLIPNAIFNKIHLFREEPMDLSEMDNTLTSRMRRKSSVRIGGSQAGSVNGSSHQPNIFVKQASNNSQKLPSLNSVH